MSLSKEILLDKLRKQQYPYRGKIYCTSKTCLNCTYPAKALNFGKSVNDNAWGKFVSFLKYKLAEQGKQLVRIDKWFPSSKTCSVCGAKKEELSLAERVYLCGCGNILDRDINAAVNIKTEAMRMLSMA